MDAVQCSQCGAQIDAALDPSPDERRPCPRCGSTVRTLSLSAVDSFEMHASLKFKHKRADGKTAAEGLSGDDLRRQTGEWVTKERLIDYENDRYKEVVTDPKTGEVIHSCEEPLSSHTGHGSAKRKENR